jgi:hypothetical protein
MLKLDSDNVEAIKDLNEVTGDESSERNESFTNSDISHLPKENEFLARWMKRWESLKQFERNSQCKGGITNSAVRQKVGKLCNDCKHFFISPVFDESYFRKGLGGGCGHRVIILP